MHEERATSVYGVPAMYVAEMALPDFASYDLTSLRTGMMSGAPCPVELMKRVLEEMHCERAGDCIWADGDFAGGDDERRGRLD